MIGISLRPRIALTRTLVLSVALGVLLSCVARSAQPNEARQPVEERPVLRLHVVGSGVPPPTRTRHGSAFALQVDRQHLLIDCGPGATCRMARMGIEPKAVDWLIWQQERGDTKRGHQP